MAARGRRSFIASSGFTRVGQPSYPDRIIRMRDGSVEATTSRFILPYRVRAWRARVRRSLGASFAVVGEVTTLFETVAHARSTARVRSTSLNGLQARRRNLQATAGLRDHRNALPTQQKMPSTSPLAGFVDLHGRGRTRPLGHLQAIGFGDAEALLADTRSHRLFLPPPGNRGRAARGRARHPVRVPHQLQHQLGFLFVVSVEL